MDKEPWWNLKKSKKTRLTCFKLRESWLMSRHAQISSRFVQSKESTTPIGVNHVPKKDVHGMFAERGQHSFIEYL
jgi:hypothetical protein